MTGRRTGTGPTARDDPVAIQLINTVGWRGDPRRRVERLPDGAALLGWARRVDLLPGDVVDRITASSRHDDTALDRAAADARRLREAVYGILDAHLEGAAAPDDDLDVVHRAVMTAVRNARPAPALPLRWRVAGTSPGDLPDALALAAAELLMSPGLSAVGRCEDTDCGWLFLDRTRSHTRRWCSSAGCGNRARVRRHYARRTADAPRSPSAPAKRSPRD